MSMPTEPAAAFAVDALRAIAQRCGGDAARQKRELLAQCARAFEARRERPPDARTLVAYHDLLLFVIAYPDSAELALAAQRELRRVASMARRIAQHGSDRQRERLAGSGTAWSTVTAAFSLSIAHWLVRRHPNCADVDSFGEGGTALADVLRLALPSIDHEALDAATGDPMALLEELAGARSGGLLAWLTRAVDSIEADADVRDHLFDSLRAYVRIEPQRTNLSRTFARGLPQATYLHSDALQKSVGGLLRLIDVELPRERILSPLEKTKLVDTARAVLAMLARETDPITWPSRNGVACFELPHGASIALFAMDPERRFALDTQTGYVLFKNRVPVGYGGGFPFLAVCKTGINVFAPFRGGESALLFAHVLRVFRHRFGIKRFVIEPYQFGARNREGLRSGAFWFYYRLGFRPVDAAAARLARAEFARIEARRGYRSPLATMRALADGDLVLNVEPVVASEVTEPADVARAVSAWIAAEHCGDRRAACATARRRVSEILPIADIARWPRSERAAFESLALPIALIPDIERWPEEDRFKLVALMRAKGCDDDVGYFVQLNRHRRLREALAHIAQRRED